MNKTSDTTLALGLGSALVLASQTGCVQNRSREGTTNLVLQASADMLGAPKNPTVALRAGITRQLHDIFATGGIVGYGQGTAEAVPEDPKSPLIEVKEKFLTVGGFASLEAPFVIPIGDKYSLSTDTDVYLGFQLTEQTESLGIVPRRQVAQPFWMTEGGVVLKHIDGAKLKLGFSIPFRCEPEKPLHTEDWYRSNTVTQPLQWVISLSLPIVK